MRLLKVCAMACGVASLAACGTELPVAGADASPSTTEGRITARAILGENRETGRVELAGAQGLTPADQEAIDRTNDAACAAGAYRQAECDRAAEASAKRRRAEATNAPNS